MVGWDCMKKKKGSRQLWCLGIRDGGMKLYEKKKKGRVVISYEKLVQ